MSHPAKPASRVTCTQVSRRGFTRLFGVATVLAAAGLGVAPGWPVASAAAAPADPARVVSVGSDVTEIVYALGRGDRVVATDTTSVYPDAAAQTTRVGYLRNLAAEGVLSLRPDLILLSAAAGPRPAIKQLQLAGARTVVVPEGYSLQTVRKKIEVIGEVFQLRNKARELLDRFDQDVSRLQELTATGTLSRPRVAFLMTARNGSPLAGGRNTAADAVIKLIGATNVFQHVGYKGVSREAMVSAAPAIILMMPHTIAASGGPQKVAAMPDIALTPAGRAGAIMSIDGPALLAFGPRTASAALALARAIRR